MQELASINHWQIDQTTTATSAVAKIAQASYAALLWDLDTINLETTLATMMLLRPEFHHPILVWVQAPTSRQSRKLFRAKVDDVLVKTTPLEVLSALIQQRLWLYDQNTLEPDPINNPPESPVNQHQIQISNWIIDKQKVSVAKDHQPVLLTKKEFQLLSYLADHQGQVLSRDQLLSEVWGYDELGSSRIVDMHIAHLRDKLEDDDQNPQHLLTVRGFGYKLI